MFSWVKGFNEEDLRKLNFKELADRFEHLSQVLPDALRCVQEVKQLQGTVQDDIKDRMAQLRQVIDDREMYLLSKVKEVEHEKLTTIERQREQCLSVLENMRAASRQAHAALTDDDPTTWLDNGRRIEEMLSQQNAVKVEYGPSPDLRFGCTLTVDLQRRILEVIDFDEKKGPTGSPGKQLSAFKVVDDEEDADGGGDGGGVMSVQQSNLSNSLLNQSGAAGEVLPDGTDYASFRRALLKEGVESSLTNLSGRLGQDYAAFKRSLLAEGADSSLPYRGYEEATGNGYGKPGAVM
ncbi:hypothetical protein GUITHDRAFT_105573 [Guillardia theta CCMP2712]|uniref:Uncharacterized protein n=1 Tax=Guillardia theta (strain CCMP2712) TaxID=905079 RepID=L1JKC8_GUITC|nr:hypothetical protein GUITHDRAFT_105573 [Guillardia theta CCMP2712]EKX48946.1 hypothetical protein GUITHDRAFT_105573 [Guillardia theta CCMP2712]|eukprot:XP_005835926.1 hypothetical protein GUITHDRAFT_105573 [Guillardia theta CCMP2712]